MSLLQSAKQNLRIYKLPFLKFKAEILSLLNSVPNIDVFSVFCISFNQHSLIQL